MTPSSLTPDKPDKPDKEKPMTAISRSDNTGAPIEIHSLTKSFGTVQALNGLDLTVHEGEVHGFLGPNGAGKSTTIRILLGLVKSDGGSARVLGGDPWTDAVALHREIAYVPGDVTLWPSLTGGEIIDLLARMRGGICEKRRAELIERFDLDPHKKARAYSKGNRQKVSLISAFSSHARLLLLDEPSAGLDPLMENVFQRCVGEARDRGVTILLSSHILAETESLCERVTIIRAGRTVESGSLDSMRHLSRTSIKAEMIGAPRDLTELKGVEDVSFDGRTLRAQVDSESLGELIQMLGEAGVRSLVSQPPTLEELFLRHYNMSDATTDGQHEHSTKKVPAL
jgi:ABC-2 type transport system ATP-binding protein